MRGAYAYFAKKQTDWERVRQHADSELPGVATRSQFVRRLENSLAEPYDPYAGLGTNLPSSHQQHYLVPPAQFRHRPSTCLPNTPFA